MLGVRNKEELESAFVYTTNYGIKAKMFYEPDIDFEPTAFATEEIDEDRRIIFKDYKTLKFERGILYYIKVFLISLKNEVCEWQKMI